MSVRPCGGGGFLAVQTGTPGRPTDFSWPFESSVHSKHPASTQHQIATSANTARLKKTVTPCCSFATNRSDDYRSAGATKSRIYGESPVVPLSIRVHRRCVFRALVERLARNQNYSAVGLQDIAAEAL